MTSDKIFDVIECIAQTSSKTSKQALIEHHAGDAEFTRVLEAALNPFKTYGLAKPPQRIAPSDEGCQFDAVTWQTLGNLASRELSGNAAKDAVVDEMRRLSSKSAQLLWRIISKDLRAGFSESTVNKAIPGHIPTFDCMLAHKFEPERIKEWPVVAEPKLDGVRVLCFVFEDERIRFFSRSGKEFTTFDHLKEPIREATRSAKWESSNFVLDGEIVSGSFNKTVSEVRKKDVQATDAEFHIFDLLPAQVFSGSENKRTYIERRSILQGFIDNAVADGPLKIIPRYLVSSVGEIHTLYGSVRARGLEGLIIKDQKAPYVCKRSHAWMKIKAEDSTDVPIVGYEEGTGKYEGMLGALIVAFDKDRHANGEHGANHDHSEAVRVNVGSGLSDSQRQSFWQNRTELFGRLIEVEYHEITPDGSLRHPRFKRFRDDKS